MTIKALISIIVFITILSSNISASANIFDDLKSGFGYEKNNVKEKPNQIRNQALVGQDEILNEAKKICEIQKGYATKHFENRQRDRSKEIEDKIAKMNKVKLLLSNNKQDVANLNLTLETVAKLLKQKSELLSSRPKDASSIDCTKQQSFTNSRTILQQTNQNLEKLDKEIKTLTREFGIEVKRLVIKSNQPKIEEEKK
jgi:hypothetical protein